MAGLAPARYTAQHRMHRMHRMQLAWPRYGPAGDCAHRSVFETGLPPPPPRAVWAGPRRRRCCAAAAAAVPPVVSCRGLPRACWPMAHGPCRTCGVIHRGVCFVERPGRAQPRWRAPPRACTAQSRQRQPPPHGLACRRHPSVAASRGSWRQSRSCQRVGAGHAEHAHLAVHAQRMQAAMPSASVTAAYAAPEPYDPWVRGGPEEAMFMRHARSYGSTWICRRRPGCAAVQAEGALGVDAGAI